MDVTVAIGTYGDPSWVDTAQRAIRSAEPQAKVIHRHGTTLAQARNEALALVQSEWVIFLDADDELTEGYVEAIGSGTADLRAPAVEYVRNGRARPARVPRVAGHQHACTGECLPAGNFLVIGSAVRTELVRRVGGFREFEWSEDWDLWLRCWLAGASVESLPEAVYRAHVRRDSRNRAPSQAERNRVHWEIYDANFGEDIKEAA